jgi:hypothetical protein
VIHDRHGRLKAVPRTSRMTNRELISAIREAVRHVERGDKIPPRLLDIDDSARYLGTSTKTIRALIQECELSYIQKIPGRSPYLLDVHDLDRWILSAKQRA